MCEKPLADMYSQHHIITFNLWISEQVDCDCFVDDHIFKNVDANSCVREMFEREIDRDTERDIE